jgi:hypothetical protein
MQGISSIPPLFAKIRLENICEFIDLEMNSLRETAGNFFAHAENTSPQQGIGREIDPLAPTHPTASKGLAVG